MITWILVVIAGICFGLCLCMSAGTADDMLDLIFGSISKAIRFFTKKH